RPPRHPRRKLRRSRRHQSLLPRLRPALGHQRRQLLLGARLRRSSSANSPHRPVHPRIRRNQLYLLPPPRPDHHLLRHRQRRIHRTPPHLPLRRSKPPLAPVLGFLRILRLTLKAAIWPILRRHLIALRSTTISRISFGAMP